MAYDEAFERLVVNRLSNEDLTSIRFAELQPGMEYYLRVRQYGSNRGDSGWSIPMKFMTKPAGASITAHRTIQPMDHPSLRGEEFGQSLASDINGQRVLVGCYSPTLPNSPGQVYIYRRAKNEHWIQEVMLPYHNHFRGRYGESLDMSYDGRMAVIGAPSYVDRGEVRCGSAVVVIREGDRWREQAHFMALRDRRPNDQHGYSVTMGHTQQETWLAIGSPGVKQNQGRVHLHEWDGQTWSDRGVISPMSVPKTMRFGHMVKMSKNAQRLFVLSLDEDDNPYVHVYQRYGKQWALNAHINITVEAPGHTCYLATDETGSRLVLGALQEKFWVFRIEERSVEQEMMLSTNWSGGETDVQARSISIDAEGRRILVGVPYRHQRQGAVIAFVRSGTYWFQDGVYANGDANEQGRFGSVVLVSPNGNSFFASAPGRNKGNGEVSLLT